MEVNRNIVEQNGNQSAKVMAEYVEQGGGGGGGTGSYTDLENKPSINGVVLDGDKSSEQLGLGNYDSLNSKPSINGVTLQGDKTGKELGLDDVRYVSTFEGVTGDADKLYFLDTEYDTYKVGFYRFIEAHGTEPAKFVRINPTPIKYVSTFNDVVGNTEDLYYLDTAYNNYEIGFYRFVEATTTEPEKFVILNKARFKYVSTFTGEVGDINRLYYLDTTYDDFKKGFYRYNGTVFVNISPKEFFYVSTFNGVVGDDEALYFLDTNYDEYTIGFYRYIEVEEAGVTVGKFIHTGNPHQLQVTYAKLKEMRDNSMLIAGKQYRITDYACTTTQADTRSANHPFDIIVTADSASTLNEEASAALHEGDTYFAQSRLSAWKLKYCLDNDTNRFSWADTANGKGVIYYMKDEWNNECPYDFKNIQYKRWKVEDAVPSRTGLNGNYMGVVNNLPKELPIPDANDFIWAYTFSSNAGGGEQADYSLQKHRNVYENVVGRYSLLNNIVFYGADCFSNTFGDGCRNITFSYRCHYNTFGGNCRNITFSHNCDYNTFGGNCHSTVFGYLCYGNVFHEFCHSNTLGDSCQGNTFNSSCNSNTFGNNCHSNTFGNSCFSNTFGNGCYRNTFGDYCNSNTFGNGCYSNTFGDYCNSNTFGDGCYSNTFGNYCTYNAFGESCHVNTFADNCSYIEFGDHTNQNYFESGVYCVVLASSTEVSSSNPLQNVRVATGVRGISPSEKRVITCEANKYNKLQVAAMTTDGKLRVWNPADMGATEESIIDVGVLPTEDIDTKSFYRLTATHYYHNGTELADPPQGYKSLNAEAVVASSNGLDVSGTVTPWVEVTDAMIATLVSGSSVAPCGFADAGFFKTAANEYDYAGRFAKGDTYTLWHNATGEPTDWVEVDSVANLVTDGETTEDVAGKLQANAVMDVATLPTTGIKAKTLYRMFVHRYLEDGEPLADTPTGYLSVRPAIVIIDENGITDNGTLYPWADITDDKMDFWVIRRQISQVYAGDLMAMSTCFRTAANHYVYKDHVTEEDVYELYHNPTATAGEFVKIGGGAASVKTDNVTTQEVDGKLQANAIVEVQTLPATGYKPNSLYRMLDTATQTFKKYYYNASADPLPETPTFYKGDGEHLVFGADGYTLNGNPGSYSSITPITMSVWTNNGWVSETTDFSEAGMFLMPGGLAVYDSTTKLTEEDYVVTAEMDKVFKRVQGGWECISYIQLEKEQYDILSEAQKNDGTLYIVNDEED